MNTKTGLLMGAAFLAGIAVVGSSYAFLGNEAVTEAIESNDYQAFLEAAPDKLLKNVTSKEAFTDFAQKKLKMKALHEEMHAKILSTVQANDFGAFQDAHKEMKTQKESLHASMRQGKEKFQPTEEQIAEFEQKQLEHFNELVAYYEENGELPARSDHLFGKAGKGGHGGDCGSKGKGFGPQGEPPLQ